VSSPDGKESMYLPSVLYVVDTTDKESAGNGEY
jgi:hypothetical protein